MRIERLETRPVLLIALAPVLAILAAFLLAGLIKIDHAVHHAVIGYRQRGLTRGLCAADQVGNARRPVEQTVLGMNVQMRKLSHAVSPLRCG